MCVYMRACVCVCVCFLVCFPFSGKGSSVNCDSGIFILICFVILILLEIFTLVRCKVSDNKHQCIVYFESTIPII